MRAATLWMAGLCSLIIGCAASDGTPRYELAANAGQEGSNTGSGGSGNDGGGCKPFSERECQCTDDTFGTQLCNEDAQGYGECINCGNPPSGGGSGGASGGGGGGGDGGGGNTTEAGDLTPNISISEVSIYQSVKIPLMSGGTVQNPNAPVVKGKNALIRVFVTPGSGWQSHQIVAELTLSDSTGETKLVSDPTNIGGASSESNLGSSLNLTVAGDRINTDTRYRVSIKEVAGTTAASGDTSGGTFPSGAAVPLGARDPNGPLRIVIVPYRYLADGSGRMPIISDSQIENYRRAALAMYPVGTVEVSVRATVDYSGAISQNGSGWESWLNHVCSVRRSDNANGKDYYWGIAAPASSWSTWGGGVAGLGNVPQASYADGRCAVGLGFSGADSDGLIMVHEIGHTLGRLHAPCQVNDADGSYPYSNATLGSWGYDSRNGQLKNPSSSKDFMSYCSPQWTSDYTYKGIFDRISYVNANWLIVPDPNSPPSTTYQRILIGLDDRVSWGYPTDLTEAPEGAVEPIELLNASGEVTGEIEGIFMPFSHGGGQILVPATSADIRYLRPEGIRIMDLSQQPSLEQLQAEAGPANLQLHVPAGHPSLN